MSGRDGASVNLSVMPERMTAAWQRAPDGMPRAMIVARSPAVLLTAGLINHEVFGNQAVFDIQDSIHALNGLGHGVAI